MLKPNRLYRRSDFLKKVRHPDRTIADLISEGILVKVLKGLYYKPAKKFFGETVPDDFRLVNKVLGRGKFLLVYPHLFNSLNLANLQLFQFVKVKNILL